MYIVYIVFIQTLPRILCVRAISGVSFLDMFGPIVKPIVKRSKIITEQLFLSETTGLTYIINGELYPRQKLSMFCELS